MGAEDKAANKATEVAPASVAVGPYEKATVVLSLEVPATAAEGEKETSVVWVRGCYEHYLRCTKDGSRIALYVAPSNESPGPRKSDQLSRGASPKKANRRVPTHRAPTRRVPTVRTWRRAPIRRTRARADRCPSVGTRRLQRPVVDPAAP